MAMFLFGLDLMSSCQYFNISRLLVLKSVKFLEIKSHKKPLRKIMMFNLVPIKSLMNISTDKQNFIIKDNQVERTYVF